MPTRGLLQRIDRRWPAEILLDLKSLLAGAKINIEVSLTTLRTKNVSHWYGILACRNKALVGGLVQK